VTEITSTRRSRRFASKSEPKRALELSWGIASDVGQRRAVNEDSVVALPGVFAVADGLGGHSAGDVASAAAVARLSQRAKARARSGAMLEPRDLEDAFLRASDDITLRTAGAAFGSGTTVTGIAVVESDRIPSFLVFNIGDSRVYRFREGELQQITVDHSYVQELVDAGELRPEEMELHPDANVITRALGFGEVPPYDSWLLHPEARDRFLICSDGLTREVPNATIAALLGAGGTAQDVARSLVAAANEAGGRDNITVAVVDVVAAPLPSATPVESTA